MQECHDEIEEDDGKGGQVIFRVVRIPFKVAFVTGNLKLRLHVEQDSRVGQVALPPPDAKLQMYVVYLKYWTLELIPLMVYPKVLFHPNFSIKAFAAQ